MKNLKALNALLGKGIVKSFSVHYYGGNDEGFVEPIEFKFYEDKDVEDIPKYAEGEAFRICEDIIEKAYGTFAGDWSTSGEIIYEAPCDKFPNGRLYNTGYDYVQVEAEPELQLMEA